VEILYELILELYLEYLRDTKKIYLQMFEELLYGLITMANLKFNNNIIENMEGYLNINKKKKNHTLFYILDKISFNDKNIVKISDGFRIKTENIKKLKELLLKAYKNEYNDKENIYSVCIIFIIKIIITIDSIDELILKLYNNSSKNTNLEQNEINEEPKTKEEMNKNNENDIHLKKVLLSVFKQLCQDSLAIYKKYNQLNPLLSEGKYNNNLYTYYKNFIIKEYNNDQHYNFNNLTEKLHSHYRYLKNFSRVIYRSDGEILLYNNKNYMILSKL
jgi:hypothetical protein